MDAALPFLAVCVAAACSCVLVVFLLSRYRAARVKTQAQAETMAEQAALLDLAHDAILVWDLQTGAIRFWNRGAEELYGLARAEALGRTPQAVLKTEFPVPLQEINAELVRTRRW